MLSKLPIVTILLVGAATVNAQSIPASKPATSAPVVLPIPPSGRTPSPVPSVKASTPAVKASTPQTIVAVVKNAPSSAKTPPVVAAAAPAAVIAPAVVPAPRPQVIVLPAAGSNQQSAVTIADLSARQAQKMAIQAAPPAPAVPAAPAVASPYRQVVPELVAGTAIPVVMDGDIKAVGPTRAAKKPVPKSYLASIIGMKGKEVAEIQTGDGQGYTLKAGDSIANWSIVRVLDGKLFLTSSEYSKKTRRTETRNRVLAVGDSL